MSRSSDSPREGWSDLLLMTDSAMFGANLHTMKPQTPKTGVAHCRRDIQWLGSRTKYHPSLTVSVPVLCWLPGEEFNDSLAQAHYRFEIVTIVT